MLLFRIHIPEEVLRYVCTAHPPNSAICGSWLLSLGSRYTLCYSPALVWE